MPRAKRAPKTAKPEIAEPPAEQGALLAPMTGTSLTYLQSIYADMTLDTDTRMDAAKTALPYEHAKAATDATPTGEGPAIKVTILRFSESKT